MHSNKRATREFVVYKRMLLVVGSWPLKKDNIFAKMLFGTTLMALMSMVIQSVLELSSDGGTILGKIDTFLFLIGPSTSLTKLKNIRNHKESVKKILLSSIDDWLKTTDSKEISIMKKNEKIAITFGKVYAILAFFTCSLFLFRTLLADFINRKNAGPDGYYERVMFQPASFIPNGVLSQWYGTLNTIQFAQCMYVCSIGIGADSMFFGVIQHLCGQFDLLKTRCEELQGSSRAERRKALISLIQRHQHLLYLGEHLEATFTNVILGQAGSTIFIICVCGCSIIYALKIDDLTTVAINAFCMQFMILQLFIYGYSGDMIMYHSEAISHAIYSATWYDLDRSLRNDVFFFLMRTKVPIRISAGKFFYISRNSFIVVLKTAVSYLSVLRIAISRS